MKYRHRVLGMLFLLSMITYIDRVCISFAGEAMQANLGMTEREWGWVLGAFALAYAIFEVPSGALGDRIGPRRVLARIVVWWSLFTSLTGAAISYHWLLATRFLFGAGEAGAFPNTSAAIARWFPLLERAQAQGLVWMASRVGGAITPFLVVSIQQTWGWRASFYVFGILGVVWAVVWYIWFRDHPSEMSQVTASEMGEIGASALPPAHVKMPWGRVFNNRNLWAILAMYHLYCYGGFFYLSWYGNFLVRGRNFEPGELKAWAWIPFILGAIANMAGGFVSDLLVRRVGLKWGRRLVGVVGLGVSAFFTAATMFTEDKLLTVIFLGLGYAGSDFMLPAAWAVCLDVGKKYAGAVTGAMNTAGQVGSFLMSVMFGYVVGLFGSYNAPLVPMTAFLIVSALLWLKIDASQNLLSEDK